MISTASKLTELARLHATSATESDERVQERDRTRPASPAYTRGEHIQDVI